MPLHQARSAGDGHSDERAPLRKGVHHHAKLRRFKLSPSSNKTQHTSLCENTKFLCPNLNVLSLTANPEPYKREEVIFPATRSLLQ